MEQNKTFTIEEFKRLVKNDFYQSLDSHSQLFIGDVHFHAASTYLGEELLDKNPDLEKAYDFALNTLKENNNKVIYQDEEYEVVSEKTEPKNFSTPSNTSIYTKKSEKFMRDSNIEMMTYAKTILNSIRSMEEIIDGYSDVEFYDTYLRDICLSIKQSSTKLIQRLENKNKAM